MLTFRPYRNILQVSWLLEVFLHISLHLGPLIGLLPVHSMWNDCPGPRWANVTYHLILFNLRSYQNITVSDTPHKQQILQRQFVIKYLCLTSRLYLPIIKVDCHKFMFIL